MKILAVYNQNFEEKSNKVFLSGVEFLKKQGHNLRQDKDFKGNLKDSSDYKKFQNKLDKAIKDTDIMIAEVSDADAKVGFDIAKALGEKKIVIALQKEGAKTGMITPIHGNKEKNLILKQYKDTNVTEVVKDAVEEAKSKMDTKFILIISPEIDRYLDWASQTKRMHKAQIVRNSIEGAIKKDREYKTYLQG